MSTAESSLCAPGRCWSATGVFLCAFGRCLGPWEDAWLPSAAPWVLQEGVCIPQVDAGAPRKVFV